MQGHIIPALQDLSTTASLLCLIYFQQEYSFSEAGEEIMLVTVRFDANIVINKLLNKLQNAFGKTVQTHVPALGIEPVTWRTACQA